MRKLRLGFDAKRLFCNKEGLGSFARTLLKDMQSLYPHHEYHLYTTSIDKEIDTEYFFDKSKFTIHLPSKSSFLWRYASIANDIHRDKIDVYIGLSNELPRGIDKSLTQTIVVVHDLFYKHFPEQFKLMDRIIVQHKFRHATNSADKVIAVSQHTAQDIYNIMPSIKEKVRVIYQSVNELFRDKNSNATDGEYILCVGSINDRKNLKLLVKAYQHLSEADRLPVKIVGTGKKYKNELDSMIKTYGFESLFEFVGYVSTYDLVHSYKGARVLVFPSKYEGFGIPALESLHVGTPVITSSGSSLTEVVGHHGIVIDYSDDVALANAIKLINKSHERASLLKDIEGHLERFSPEKICDKYISVINGLMSTKQNQFS